MIEVCKCLRNGAG